jgi:hypothetical protein
MLLKAETKHGIFICCDAIVLDMMASAGAHQSVFGCAFTNPYPSPDYASGVGNLRRRWRESGDSHSKLLLRHVASDISRAPQPP